MIIHIAKWKLPDVIIGQDVKLQLRSDTDKEFKCLVADITEDEVLVIPREPVVSSEECQEFIKRKNQFACQKWRKRDE